METKNKINKISIVEAIEFYRNLPATANGMSNYNHTIDENMDKDLRNGMYGTYVGWDFNGKVFFKDDQFHCVVWVYKVPVELISANTLQEIMTKVSDLYGSD